MSSHYSQSNILALGDLNAYRKLFNRINEKFGSNLLANNLNIIETSTSCVFQLSIKTKYYSLVSKLTVISSEDIQLKDPEDLEGVFICLNKTDEFFYLKNESIQKLLAENKTCYKALIFSQKWLEITNLTKDLDDLIQIEIDLNRYSDLNQPTELVKNAETEQDDNEEDFNELDEFVNSLFVHSWPHIKLENSPKQSKEAEKYQDKDHKVVDDNESGEEDAAEEDNFNFENLISNLSEIKAKASGMSFEERKLYAEAVVTKFWRSIGGDEDEIEDFND